MCLRASFEKQAFVQTAREGSSSRGDEVALAEAGGAPAGDSILGSGHEFVSKRMAKSMHSMHHEMQQMILNCLLNRQEKAPQGGASKRMQGNRLRPC